MGEVVEKGLCVDFHIHSTYSNRKDKDCIENNTVENLNVLFRRMKNEEFSIDMFSITDHDFFSYELYCEAKKSEKSGLFKKILPGIEFSVMMNSLNSEEKMVHVVCLFNDENEEAVSKIQDIFKTDNELYAYDMNEAYSEKKFIEIIKKIGLDVIMIAHQKNPITSKTPRHPDAFTLGEETFNQLLFYEYFEAFEFRNKNYEIYNNISKYQYNKENERLRFITGSDCHVWENYPAYKKPTEIDYRPTFLKCLPTFRGIAMAMTDDSRISLTNNFFSSNNYLDELKFNIMGKDETVKLSKGINAIIGDNSVGKSLILHALTDYSKRSGTTFKLSEDVKNGYEKYLNDNNISVNTKIKPEQILMFDAQGEIRNKFNLKQFDSSTFLNDRFPEKLDTETYLTFINFKLEKFYKSIEDKIKYDMEESKLKKFEIMLDDVISITFVYSEIGVRYFSNQKIKAANKIITKLNEEIAKLENLLKDDSDDMSSINIIKIEIEKLNSKYLELQKQNDINKTIGDIINAVVNKKTAEYQAIQTEEGAKKTLYSNNLISIRNTIAELCCQEKNIIHFEFDSEVKEIKPNHNTYFDYTFYETVDFPDQFEMKIGKKYFDYLVKQVLSSRTSGIIDTKTITNAKLLQEINESSSYTNGLECLKFKINEQVTKHFRASRRLVKGDNDVTHQMSAGINSQMYFDILAGISNSKDGIYIIDQPEDDVSQLAIKETLIKDFKQMSAFRQIILVTHNPQFVVNLDVDNVIFIHKTNEKIEMINGALEYKNDFLDILQIVSDNLDGGMESIKKRWKRYEKNIGY